MVVVTTNILVMPVLCAVTLLLGKRLVLSLLGGLVVSVDKLLPPLPRLIRLKDFLEVRLALFLLFSYIVLRLNQILNVRL